MEKKQEIIEKFKLFMNDPDFHKLPLPKFVAEALNINIAPRYISAVEAVNTCFNTIQTNNELYKSNTIEVIDQTEISDPLPNLESLVDSTESTDSKSQE